MTMEESYSLALKEKKEKLSGKKAKREKEISELSKNKPEYTEICISIARCGTAYAKAAFSGDKKILDSLKEKIEELSEKKEEILKGAGISEIKFDCPLCEDSGYKEGKLCECIRHRAKQILIETLSKEIPVGENTFENFDLSYYADEQQRARMSKILDFCKAYAREFGGETKENLLFMGNAGLGKTHISISIVSELVKKGYAVLYGSAFNIFAKMESEHFDKHTNETFDAAVNCDLLCIDDLGTEFISPYVQSLVYNIINTRILKGKPMIISTNLSISELEKRYSERVASRFIGNFTAKSFVGNDIRQIKALNKKK